MLTLLKHFFYFLHLFHVYKYTCFIFYLHVTVPTNWLLSIIEILYISFFFLLLYDLITFLLVRIQHILFINIFQFFDYDSSVFKSLLILILYLCDMRLISLIRWLLLKLFKHQNAVFGLFKVDTKHWNEFIQEYVSIC